MEQSVRGNTCTSLDEYIVQGSKTGGSETSQYPEEEKINNDSVSSGERTRKSPNFNDFCLQTYLFTDMRVANKLVDECY